MGFLGYNPDMKEYQNYEDYKELVGNGINSFSDTGQKYVGIFCKQTKRKLINRTFRSTGAASAHVTNKLIYPLLRTYTNAILNLNSKDLSRLVAKLKAEFFEFKEC